MYPPVRQLGSGRQRAAELSQMEAMQARRKRLAARERHRRNLQRQADGQTGAARGYAAVAVLIMLATIFIVYAVVVAASTGAP